MDGYCTPGKRQAHPTSLKETANRQKPYKKQRKQNPDRRHTGLFKQIAIKKQQNKQLPLKTLINTAL